MKPYILRASMALAVGLCVAIPAAADSPPPYPEFTFKMGKPPKKGTKKRINVQIEPGDQVVAKPAKPKPDDAGTGTQSAAASTRSWSRRASTAITRGRGRRGRRGGCLTRPGGSTRADGSPSCPCRSPVRNSNRRSSTQG